MLEIEYTQNHKPFVRNSLSIFFSISHTGDYLAIVLSDQKHIGVDLERKRQKKHARIVDSYFAEEEKKRIGNTTSGTCDLFYYFWTRKEALMKVLGIGMHESILQLDTTKSIVKNNDVDYHFETYDLSHLYCSVCWSVPDVVGGCIRNRRTP